VLLLPWFWPCAEGLPKLAGIHGCNKLVRSDLVKKLGLTTRPHPHPYHLMWFNDVGKAKVIHTCIVSFSIGSYASSVDCDVVPMEACSILLGHLHTMVEVIHTLLCIKERKLLCYF
jgi:hypothetical protein